MLSGNHTPTPHIHAHRAYRVPTYLLLGIIRSLPTERLRTVLWKVLADTRLSHIHPTSAPHIHTHTHTHLPFPRITVKLEDPESEKKEQKQCSEGRQTQRRESDRTTLLLTCPPYPARPLPPTSSPELRSSDLTPGSIPTYFN